MLQFKFQKISRVPPDFFKKRAEIGNYLRILKEVLKEKNYSLPESFLILPGEKPISFKRPFKKPKLIFLIGIGGSILGTQAIYRALENKKDLIEMIFIDNVNPLLFRKIVSRLKSVDLKKGEIALCFISKTGKTFEPIANFFVLSKFLEKYNPEIFVITAENTPLWNFAKRKNWKLLPVPEVIGGRHSVFSNVGVIPLYLAGINIKELLNGAREANRICLEDDIFKNPALTSAQTIFYHWKSGKNIYSNLVFPPDLEFFGKWYCQLVSEDLGKKGKGITPTVTIGTCDFHSLGQLYFDGPRDKLINFVFVENLGPDFTIAKMEDFSKILPGLEGLKTWELNKAIFEGVKKAYLKKDIPFTETILPKMDERNLGALMEMKMIEVIILGKLMKIYVFDQPGVELYKEEAGKILKKKSKPR